MTGSAWRVQPLTAGRMGVLVDAWHEFAVPFDIPAADVVHDRIDVIAERPLPGGGLDVRVFVGTPGYDRPPLPDGFAPIAVVWVRCGQRTIAHCHIADP